MAYGDIGPIIDTEIWGGVGVYLPFITHATGDIYLITKGSPFEIYSHTIDDDGNIGPRIDFLTLGGGANSGSKFIRHIDGDVYAVAYAGAVNNVVETFTCDAAGNLGAAAIDTEILSLRPGNSSFYPFLLHATGDIYIVDYTDNADDGWTKSLRINNDGTIDPFLFAWEHEASRGHFPWLVHVGGNMYAVVSSSTVNNWGRLRTFTVSGVGAISGSQEWIFEGADDASNSNCVVEVTTGIFALFYQGAAGVGGRIKTVSLDPVTGFIVPLDTWNYDAGVSQPFATEVSRNAAGTGKIFCVGNANDSAYQVWTLEILNNGTIITAMIDTLTLVPADWATSVSLVRFNLVDAIYFGACYVDLTGGNTSVLKTFEVEGLLGPPVVQRAGLNPALAEALDI